MYYTMPTFKLIENYFFEKDRVNEQDRITTQNHIKKELQRRFDTVMEQLDDACSTDYGCMWTLLGIRPPEEWGMEKPSARK